MKRFFLVVILFFSMITSNGQTAILYGEKATAVERNAANDLKSDILHVYPDEEVELIASTTSLKKDYERVIIIGTKQSNQLINKLFAEKKSDFFQIEIEPETFVLQTLPFNSTQSQKALYIAGADDRGTYYGVYEFSERVLGIDAFEYWTDKKPKAPERFDIPHLSFREKPPVFPMRGYFDNDDDMLANWKGRKLIVEFDTWKEIINSLSRLRYNYIDAHDLMGRPEFWVWDYYKNMTEYHTDLELLDKVFDYAHSKGMMVQIPMYLGWEFKHIDFDKICLTEHHDHWMEVYEYYLTKTPLQKGDIFLARPRHPIYDYGYSCEKEKNAGIKAGPLMTKMFQSLKDLIDEHRPGSTVVCDLWREGRPMWQSDEFAPNKDIQMLWADYYGGDFREWPERQKGYDFGIYVHAGIWLNHVIQDPLVHQIDAAVKEAVSREMIHNIFVNGQDFKHFILNLEVCARLAWNPEAFDPDAFYTEWTSRYFGEKASPLVVNSLKLLNEAHTVLAGYKEVTTFSVITLNNLEHKELKLSEYKAKALKAIGLAEASLQTAIAATALVPEESRLVYDDQIVFPATLYLDNIRLLKAVVHYAEYVRSGVKDQKTYEGYAINMKNALVKMRTTLDTGGKWKKWDGWTKCENFRVFTPPPQVDEVENIIEKYRF
ncbi:MAG: glycosyl hydrolase 115 family protein [Bacteroidota bacterium]